MRWSWKLGEVKGIAIRVHWTFLILPLWVGWHYWSAGAGGAVVFEAVAFLLAIFGCVVLHELGHALTARRYGVRTRDITLLPIGGMARMERIPEQWSEEFWIAIAGPAVNVVIAGVLLALLNTFGEISHVLRVDVTGGSFLARLMWVNVALTLFNLLPAFPMDGGRILRALLARRRSYVRATQIAASVGQAMAILFGVLGILGGNFILLFIALFVFIGASAESQAAEMRSILKEVHVCDAMQTRFCVLTPNDTLKIAVDDLLAADQQDFPVVEGHRVAGILLRQRILEALADGERHRPVRDLMDAECLLFEESDLLETALSRMRETASTTAGVVRGGELVGILTHQNIAEWIQVQIASASGGTHATTRSQPVVVARSMPANGRPLWPNDFLPSRKRTLWWR